MTTKTAVKLKNFIGGKWVDAHTDKTEFWVNMATLRRS